MPSDHIAIRKSIEAIMTARGGKMIKRNKLRKLVCKDIKEMSWTEFQEGLDALSEEGGLLVERKLEGDEAGDWVALSSSGSVTGTTSGNKRAREEGEGGRKGEGEGMGDDTQRRSTEIPEEHVVVKKVQVPDALVFHLKKNSGKKLTNIEVNTKTMLHVMGVAKNGTCMLRLSGESDKRINAAMVIIEKLRRSVKSNPDRFTRDGAKLTGRALHDYREELKLKTKKAKKEGKGTKKEEKEKA